MDPKPAGWSASYRAVFEESDVVEAYRLRPQYPDETISELVRINSGGAVLDAGCGTGDLARRLAPHVERVDGVDLSERMIVEASRTAREEALQNVRWLHGAIEEVELDPPYTLVVAGDSVHWFDWSQVVPRFASVLAPDGLLAVVQRDWLRDCELRDRLRPVYARHSWNREYTPLDPVDELERRGLFRRLGQHTSAPSSWRPTLDDVVECHFSMSGFARSRLKDADGFARELRDVIAASLTEVDGRFQLDVVGTVIWGRLIP
jgi:ubiquinone/menaquinone biosynthesis C-methylase UbiE